MGHERRAVVVAGVGAYASSSPCSALAPDGETLDTKHLPDELVSPPPRAAKQSAARTAEDAPEGRRPPVPDALRAALKEHGGNVAALARVFRRDRSLIHCWLKQHGIEPETFREG